MLEQLSLYLSGGSQRFRGGQRVEFVQSMVRDREPLKVVPSAFRRRPEQASNYTERNQELFSIRVIVWHKELMLCIPSLVGCLIWMRRIDHLGEQV